jgi:hypothetical protein
VRAHDGNGGVSPTTQISIEIQPPTVQGPPFVGDVAEINPDSPLIGTPVYPSFILNSAELVSCEDLDYLKVEVRNNGPFYFQWVNFHVWYADGPINFNNWEDPWVFDGSACPVPAAGSPSLAPGSSAFIYFPITPIFPFNDFLVNLQMCTYADFPDSCPEETVEFVEDLWHIVKLKEVALCWVGPGPDYEVVNSIAEGRSVELLGKGDVEGFLVVQEPKYKRPCWLLEESAEKIPDEVEQELTTFETPRLPDGVVSGKVFKDQDGNGEFGGSDVGFSGAKVALAPGMCSNPGQAMTITTNNNGRYSFDTVAPGQYCLYVPKPSNCQNFSTADGYDISVGWGSVIEVNFGLLACR